MVATSQRGAGGRFAKGNAFATGNANHKKMYELRQSFLSAVSEADVRAVAKKLVEMAKEGDLEAARVLLSFTIGKPPTKVEISEEPCIKEYSVTNDPALI